MDVKQLSSDLFANAAAAAHGNETTPAVIGAEIIELCEALKTDPPAYVEVQKDSNGLYGFCNLGVLEKIASDGGTIRFGWIIWEYPRIYLTAEFHAVWVNSTGRLIDITPKPDGERRIVFAGDPTYSPDFDFTKRPNNRRTRIFRPDNRAKLAQARIAKFTASQIEYETKRAIKKCMTLEQWVESRFPIDPLPDLIDAFIRLADERESLWEPLGTGIGTRCINPHRAMELAQNLQHKLREIQKLLSIREP